MSFVTVINNIGTILEGISYVVSGAAVVAAVVPKAQNAVPVLQGIRKVIDLLALNVGNAKNGK